VLIGWFCIHIHYDLPRDDGTLARIQAAHVWRIGMDISDPPFASEPDHTPIGFDVDLAHALGDRLGVTIQIVPLGYDGLYDALTVGGVDGVISALTVDPLRLRDVQYSLPYFDDGLVLVVSSQTAMTAGGITMNDLDGKRIATEAGSEADQEAQRWQRRLHILTELTYPTANAALDAVRANEAEAGLTDDVTARLAIRTKPGLTISAQFVTHQPYSVAVRYTSRSLIDSINTDLAEMQADGTLDRLITRWL
jgi:polar amino acid transport system substrate-binding protein